MSTRQQTADRLECPLCGREAAKYDRFKLTLEDRTDATFSRCVGYLCGGCFNDLQREVRAQ